MFETDNKCILLLLLPVFLVVLLNLDRVPFEHGSPSSVEASLSPATRDDCFLGTGVSDWPRHGRDFSPNYVV